MKAIVHIGTEKTGTTSIQGLLYLNRKKLRKAGFHFLQCAGPMNSRAIPAYCLGDDSFDDFFRDNGITTAEAKEKFRATFRRDFEQEIRELPDSIHTVIISSEHLHSRIRSVEEMDKVHELLTSSFDEIRIICYLREQAATCTSFYSTYIKTGGTESLKKVLKRCKPGNPYFNYDSMLANWERCFGIGSLDINLFSSNHFLNGNLLDDFAAKIDSSLVGTLDQNVDDGNESLVPSGQALARTLNVLFPDDPDRPKVREFREKCMELVVQALAGRGQQPDFASKQMIYRLFQSSNEEIRLKFFPTIDVLFPPPADVATPDAAVDQNFFSALELILSMIRKNGISLMRAEDYPLLWSVLTTCIDDAVKVKKIESLQTQPDVILEDKDAHMLKDIALKIEEAYPNAAAKLMNLASQVKPDYPAIQAKMAEFQAKGLLPSKPGEKGR